MAAKKDIVVVNEIADEKVIKNDLDGILVPGAIYYRGVFINNFTKRQLINLIYLLMEGEE